MKTEEWNPLLENYSDYLERCWTRQLFCELQDIFSYYSLPMRLPHLNFSDDTSRYGSFDANRYLISISRKLVKEHSWDLVIEILKHEVAHLIVFQRGEPEEAPHGSAFQAACQRIGVAPWARHASIEIDPLGAMADHRKMADEEARLLQRIEKLLSLASSTNEHEASLAMQRAKELCERHHLESLLARKKSQYTYVVINHRKRQIPAFQWRILHILNEYFYVSSVSRGLYSPEENLRHRVVDIMGTRENVQMAEYVYWFLYNQLPILFEQFKLGKTTKARNTRNSFYLGVLRGFSEKLASQQVELKSKRQEWGLVSSLTEHRALELASKQELNLFVRNRYPSISGGSGRNLMISEEAYSSGKERGRELNLHRGLHQSHEGQVHLLK